MDKKPEGPKTGSMVGLGLAMVICCGGFTLLAAGALSGVGAWLFDGGLTWLALAFILGAGGVFLWRRRTGGADGNVAAHHPRATDLPNQPVKRPRISPAEGRK
ncbi:MAG: mercury transporter [Proteobacteria bacterium]|nr:mercury transporter [Pseudomonadota bacterium]